MQHKSARDHILAVLKAGANAVPMVGGPLASLIGDYIPTATQRDTERALELLGEKIAALGTRVDVESVNKDEFSELFKSCYLVIVRTHQEEKLRAAANILANLLLRPNDPAKVSYSELDHLIRCAENLSIGAISALGAARRVATTAGQGSQGHFQFSQLHETLAQMDSALVMSLVSELRAFNLIHVQEPSIRMPNYANYLIELTPIGRRFIERFIEG